MSGARFGLGARPCSGSSARASQEVERLPLLVALFRAGSGVLPREGIAGIIK